MKPELIEAERARSIIGAFYAVYDYFGYGLAETVYVGALAAELESAGHVVTRELAIAVHYKGRRVAWQRLDMVVDQRIVVEAKASEKLSPFAERQVLNYLRVSSFEVGLLFHFGPEPRFRRFVDTNKKSFRFMRVRSHERQSAEAETSRGD